MGKVDKSTILEAIAAIFDRDDLDRNDKLIAIYLIRRGALNGHAFPTYASISKECGIGRTTVYNSIQKMVRLGLVTAEGGGGNRYVFTVHPFNHRTSEQTFSHSEVERGGSNIEPGNECLPVQNLNGTRSEFERDPFRIRTGPVQNLNRHPKENIKEKSKETIKGNSRADPSEDDALSAMHKDADPAEALVRMYNMLDPPDSSNYQRFTVARYQQMQAALDAGATYEIVAQVIQEMAATAKGPWEVRKEAVRRARGELTGDAGEITAGATRENRKSDRYRGFFSQVF